MKISETKDMFLTDMNGRGYSKRTLALYDYVITRLIEFLKDPNIKDIKPNDLTRFIVYMRDDYTPTRKNGKTDGLCANSLQKFVNGIRVYFKFAVESLELQKNPALNVKRIPTDNTVPVIPFTRDEVNAIIDAAQKTRVRRNQSTYVAKRRTWRRDVAIIYILMDTGLRIGELCRLNIEDVDLKTGETSIAPFGFSVRKTRSRIVHLGNETRKFVWLYLINERKDDYDNNPVAPLFTDEHNRSRITENAVRCFLKTLEKHTGVKDVHPHRFRHTFCIEFLRNDGDIFTLQSLTGHATLDMLQTYVHIAKVDTARVHRRASPMDNWKL